MRIDFYNGISNGRGFEFSLFPVITLTKTKWKHYNEFEMLIGLWFWGLELEWKRNRKKYLY